MNRTFGVLYTGLLLVSGVLIGSTCLAVIPPSPPLAIFIDDNFEPMSANWQPAAGAWSVQNGHYVDTAAGDDIATIATYEDPYYPSEPYEYVPYGGYVLTATMRNPGSSDAQRVGLVYQYQDAANYYEALVSAKGTVSLERVVAGVRTQVASTQWDIDRNIWFTLEVRWTGTTTLKVNGITVFADVAQPELTYGQIGVGARGTVAQFDDVRLEIMFGDQPFQEDFSDGIAQGWEPQSGQWNIASGMYRDAAVQQTNVTLAPIHTDLYETMAFTLRARMLNPYGASGNLVGIVFDYGGPLDYHEVVFSPTGVAKINQITNGSVRTLAAASYNGRQHQLFDVAFSLFQSATVWVDGIKLFDAVSIHPGSYPTGGVGLITHWTPGRFDDVWFDHGAITTLDRPPPETFNGGLPPAYDVTGTWNADGGVLKNTSVAMTNRFILRAPGSASVMHARLLNEYGASGNLVGVIYDYQQGGLNAGDYYEVLFSTTGRVLLRKVIGGTTSTVLETTYSTPRNAWFDVDVIRDGAARTTIKVNGTPVISGVRQGSFVYGALGAVTHWSKGRFDDFTVSSLSGR
jgi:hypothetical protein